MSAVERLQAAIDKLERLRAEATPNPWHASGRYIGHREADGKSIRYHLRAGESDADLIVTLHRTINAQLAILRAGIKNESVRRSSTLWSGLLDESACALADAILGSDS